MKQDQDREQWIAEVMTSTEGIQLPEGNPFLYEKIKYRMESGRGAIMAAGSRSLLGWSLAILMLLAVNGISIASKINREKHTLRREAYNAIAPEMQTGTIYNY